MRVEVLTDRPDQRFVADAIVHPEGSDRRLTVASASPVADGPGWWLAFREVRSRTAAEGLRDAFLEMEVDSSKDLEAGQAYWHEVEGSEVMARDGSVLGRVTEIYRAGEAEVYVVDGGPAGEFDLPAVQGIVLEFAPRAGRIVIDEVALDLGGTAADARPTRPHRRHRWSRHGKAGGPAGAAGLDGPPSLPSASNGPSDPSDPEGGG